MKIKATISSEKITSNSAEAQSLFSDKNFGERFGEKIIYSLPEAFFLMKKGDLELFDLKNKKLKSEEAEKKFEKIDKKFKDKYLVFKDLRSKGYILKSALKFGADFRVYEKNSSKEHSKWICYVDSSNKNLTWQEFVAKNRIAHSIKKNLLIAIVDEEMDVSYFEVSWTKP